ncbi:MAG: tyrosine-type recombinase/integrase, partial [Gammaproteobacteria bacterium]|nr:tyrosine-type recombinase/integrase [Gammaproteobacteria bacterium]
MLTEAQRKALLAQTAKDPQLHLLVVLALSTAARAGELVALRWNDVDLKERRLLLRRPRTRSHACCGCTGRRSVCSGSTAACGEL